MLTFIIAPYEVLETLEGAGICSLVFRTLQRVPRTLQQFCEGPGAMDGIHVLGHLRALGAPCVSLEVGAPLSSIPEVRIPDVDLSRTLTTTVDLASPVCLC